MASTASAAIAARGGRGAGRFADTQPPISGSTSGGKFSMPRRWSRPTQFEGKCSGFGQSPPNPTTGQWTIRSNVPTGRKNPDRARVPSRRRRWAHEAVRGNHTGIKSSTTSSQAGDVLEKIQTQMPVRAERSPYDGLDQTISRLHRHPLSAKLKRNW